MKLCVNIEKVLPGFTLTASFTAGNETIGLIGASGSGKSMTLRCIAGLLTPTRGRIVINDRVLYDSAQGINVPSRERNVGFLFQNYALFPHMTVRQNIAMGLKKRSRQGINSRMEELLSKAQLEGLEDRFPHQLSGGQQQRVAIARSLALDPDILLLDEPFSALDNHLRRQMESQMADTLASFPGASIFVTHNIEESYRLCDKILVLSEGRVIAQGDKHSVFVQPPSLAAALLTGDLNISRIQITRDNKVEALDWDCTLDLPEPVSHDKTHVGIRPHHLTFVDHQDQPNTIPCWPCKITEAPHRVQFGLYLHSPHKSAHTSLLWGDVYKETWQRLTSKEPPWLLRLDPKHLFFMIG